MSERKNAATLTPYIVIVAGMPRSGSTWVFNAARLILDGHYSSVHAAWCGDYKATDNSPVHLVKLHKPDEAKSLVPDVVLTSYREFSECIASRIRIGWLKNDAAELKRAYEWQSALYEYWRFRSNHEVNFENIINHPEKEVLIIANVLNIQLNEEAVGGVFHLG